MELLKEVFANIDSKIFESEEVQTKITEAFEKRVDEKANEKANELFESKEAEYLTSLDEQIKAVRESIELDQKEKFNGAVETKVQELLEAKVAEITEKSEKEVEEQITEMLAKNKKFIQHSVQQFVDEAMPVWQQEKAVLESAKLKEEFTTLAEAFGLSISKLDESEELTKANKSLEESIDTISTLKESISKMECEKILNESKEGLTSPQFDKLVKLMESVETVDIEAYANKLGLYKATLGDVKINEEKKTNSGNKSSWKK